jgi:hypothetical protein
MYGLDSSVQRLRNDVKSLDQTPSPTKRKEKSMNYNDRFLQLRCSTDVLNAVYPLRNPRKEISESMAIIQKIKGLTVTFPRQFNIVDICAGNALTSILAIHLLPITTAMAIDIKKNPRDFTGIKNFAYNNLDLLTQVKSFSKESIVISSHPCKLATRIIDLYNASHATALCIIPCCRGEFVLPGKHFLNMFTPNYDLWCYYLSTLIKDSKVRIVKDRKILSPCNDVIYAERINA